MAVVRSIVSAAVGLHAIRRRLAARKTARRAQQGSTGAWRAGVVDGRRSATTGTQDDIGDVRGAGRGVDPRLDRVQLDREVVAEQPAEVVGTYVVGRVDAAGLHMLAVLVVDVVVDRQQQPT